ncbi:MAG: 30S ribosomal protein S5 [Patescibacteria group bacterium]
MTKEDEIKNEIVETETVVPTASVVDAPTNVVVDDVNAAKAGTNSVVSKTIAKEGHTRNDRDKKPRGRGGRPGRRGSFERVKPEFDQKMIDIRRVTRVVAGGRRFSFSVALVIGDRKGAVGVGTGKANDTSLAIEKAFRDARKNILRLKLTKNMSIPHAISAKYSSAVIMLTPNKGKGLVVGSSARIALDLAGVKDTTAKIYSGSKNKLNIARATIKALSNLLPPKEKEQKQTTDDPQSTTGDEMKKE